MRFGTYRASDFGYGVSGLLRVWVWGSGLVVWDIGLGTWGWRPKQSDYWRPNWKSIEDEMGSKRGHRDTMPGPRESQQGLRIQRTTTAY